ncbi:SNF2 helicase associated domain-containing protein [Clostridium ganghwense]
MYTRGEVYYLQGNVVDLETGTVNRKEVDGKITVIKGNIKSDDGNRIYKAFVEVNEYGGIVDVNCDCQAFMNYFPAVGVCKHVIALLLKYVREKDLILKPRGSKKIKELINALSDGLLIKDSNYGKKQINIEYRYEYESYNGGLASLQLKVGENTLYVVKNIKEFLEVVNNKEKTIYFGQKFTFDPTIHQFKEEDNEIIKVLMEIYEMNDKVRYLDNHSYSSNRFLKGKKAYLIDSQIKRVFPYLKGKGIEVKFDYGDIIKAEILEEDMPLEFDIMKERKDIVLEQKGLLPIPITKDGEYFFYGSNIYKPTKEQREVYIPFYHILIDSKHRSIRFDNEDSEELASYIIPSLRKVSSEVNIDSGIVENLYEEPLKTAIYLDKEGNGVSAKVKYIYGEIEINPLRDEDIRKEKTILVRDIRTEIKSINSILNFGFEKGKNKFILKNDERLIDFLLEGIEKLQEIGEVYYSEDFKNVKIYNSSSITSSIKMNDEDLLEFTFDIEGVDREELKNIFEALREKKKYYKLKKGGFIPLDSEELNNFTNMIDYLNIKDSDLDKEKILLSKYNALYIEQSINDKNIKIKKDEKFKELVNNIREMKQIELKPKEELNKIMRGYQKFGFKWLKTLSKCGFGGILADEMGLGKTLQAISFIQSEVEEGEKVPCLVVAPTSLVYNWKDEIEKFAPNLKTLIITGSKKERRERLKEIYNYDIILTSYPLIRRDIEEYKEINFKYSFLDEAQYIKNPSSINSKAVKELKAKGYFALTGTPIENSLTELWSIFDFIMPGYLMNHSKFSQKYEGPIVKNNDMDALKELNKHIKPFILRRVKKDVIKELPPKIEHKVLVEMTSEQKKIYAAYLTNAKEEVSKEIREKGFKNSKFKILSILTRLRQICCDPTTFISDFKGESGKMEVLDNLLEDSIKSGHRILLFSQFTSVLKNIEKRLSKNKIEYMYLDGQTKMEHRGEMVKSFNEGEGNVFLISLKAGGTGLNLTGADTVIHFDPWWNPAVEEQASDRAHRIGQKKTVEVIKLISRGTIEEKIYKLQKKKKEIIKNVMDSEIKEESLISQMNEDEIKELFI